MSGRIPARGNGSIGNIHVSCYEWESRIMQTISFSCDFKTIKKKLICIYFMVDFGVWRRALVASQTICVHVYDASHAYLQHATNAHGRHQTGYGIYSSERNDSMQRALYAVFRSIMSCGYFQLGNTIVQLRSQSPSFQHSNFFINFIILTI